MDFQSFSASFHVQYAVPLDMELFESHIPGLRPAIHGSFFQKPYLTIFVGICTITGLQQAVIELRVIRHVGNFFEKQTIF